MKSPRVIWGLLTITIALSAQGQSLQAPAFLNDGLVAYYPFNGNANDATGNGNNLQNYGAVLCPNRFGAAPYANYQLEFTPDLSAAWSDVGTPFSTPSTTNAYYLNLTGPSGFYRVAYLSQ